MSARVRRFERAMREHRAYTEAFRVVPLDGRVDGTYRVSGASGSAYHVDIVDRSGLNDACSCADFLGNELGTCKHLEAVRRGIARVTELERAFRRLPELPRRPVLTVRAAGPGPASLWAVGDWEDDDLRRLGLARSAREGRERRLTGELRSGGAVSVEPRASLIMSEIGPARVVHAALVLCERLRRAALVRSRGEAIARAVAAGSLGLDVLSVPLFPYQREGVAHLLRSGRAILPDRPAVPPSSVIPNAAARPSSTNSNRSSRKSSRKGRARCSCFRSGSRCSSSLRIGSMRPVSVT